MFWRLGDETETPPSPSFHKVAGRFLWRLVVSVAQHDLASLAAVIAFYAFFSLFPLLLLLIYGASLLLPQVQVEKVVGLFVTPYFPAWPRNYITSNLPHLTRVGVNVGIVSAVILTWSATSGFIAVQQALDVVWNSQQRSFVKRRLIAFAMLLILLLLTLGSEVVMALTPLVKYTLVRHAAFFDWVKMLHAVSRVLFPLSLFVGCLVVYRYLPSRQGHFVYLVPGALVTTVAVDAGRAVFTWYASHLVMYQLIYGTLTVVMLVILWMYLASLAMLFGAEVSANLQALDDELSAGGD
ncbi:YihY/virulence factor BrkB family protein [Alicyclobacillus herbarius]|uniref:YihY/virulence factor BrkB family protein n=1 Tax=Alicyclobacillus herbarius TaxID=122960 RepID=UPI001FDFC59A|nr:YihY/virulence factor BrkB family protein [Alicyclobacillus herbarius]